MKEEIIENMKDNKEKHNRKKNIKTKGKRWEQT